MDSPPAPSPSSILPLLITTPHSSARVPEDILRRMEGGREGETREALERRLFLQGDPLTDRIFRLDGARHLLHAPVSRFVADLNRAPAEEGENGVIKVMDFSKNRLYAEGAEPDAAEIERRLRLYHGPFHAEIARLMEGPEVRFLLDGHSMEERGPALGPDDGERRPALCLGNFGNERGESVERAPLSCPALQARDLAARLEEALAPLWEDASLMARLSGKVLLNRPFDGGYLVAAHTWPRGKAGVMLEVNRALYFDEAKAEALPGRVELLRQGIGRAVAGFLRKWQDGG